jgi:protein associated with RNAse G/E
MDNGNRSIHNNNLALWFFFKNYEYIGNMTQIFEQGAQTIYLLQAQSPFHYVVGKAD